MNCGQTVFSQLTSLLPLPEFRTCVKRYGGNKRLRKFSCWDQFLCMAFAQLTYRQSLRDIEICLRAQGSKLYHLGIRGHISKSTLADANELRDWRIYQDFALEVIGIARQLYADEKWSKQLDRAVYALDSTTVDLCLALFPWAKFRTHKAAVKIHTLLDVASQIPSVIHITPGNIHDVNILDDLVFEPGAIYLMDRGYLDFERFYRFHLSGAFFVTRTKKNLRFRHIDSYPVDKSKGLRFDQRVKPQGFYASKDYPESLRRIGFTDPETQKRLTFLTNCFESAADVIAALYRSRWSVELFFKWIKQNLRIKTFYGTTQNAVKAQIWIAITVYVLVAILKKEMRLKASLSKILQVFSIHVFEKTPIAELLCENESLQNQNESCKQLLLFDF